MLIESGPLLSLSDHRQATHEVCQAILKSETLPFITTWACRAEVMYLVGRLGSFYFQQYLWDLLQDGNVLLHHHEDEEVGRIPLLMERYQNVPMDLADASLVSAAESRGDRSLFTLDSDFRIYCLADGGVFDIVPE